MKITAIKQQTKNRERVSIFLDEKYSFSLSLDELVKYKLKNGDDLDAADVKKYKKISEDGKLRARALEWLLNRPHSIREFKDYLYRKKADPQLGESLIAEFSQKKYLDETKFGQWFVELQARRAKSDRAIRAELFKKGLDRELVDQLMQDSDSSEEQRLKELVAKKRQSARYKNDPTKLAKYLTSQGFSWQSVKQALALDIYED